MVHETVTSAIDVSSWRFNEHGDAEHVYDYGLRQREMGRKREEHDNYYFKLFYDQQMAYFYR